MNAFAQFEILKIGEKIGEQNGRQSAQLLNKNIGKTAQIQMRRFANIFCDRVRYITLSIIDNLQYMAIC